LIRIDLQGQPYPGLASAWSPSDDGRSWSFTIAEEVKFTWELIAGLDSFGIVKDLTRNLEAVEVSASRSVTITFEQPVANAEERFGFL